MQPHFRKRLPVGKFEIVRDEIAFLGRHGRQRRICCAETQAAAQTHAAAHTSAFQIPIRIFDFLLETLRVARKVAQAFLPVWFCESNTVALDSARKPPQAECLCHVNGLQLGPVVNASVSNVFCSSSCALAEPVAGLALAERFTERTGMSGK